MEKESEETEKQTNGNIWRFPGSLWQHRLHIESELPDTIIAKKAGSHLQCVTDKHSDQKSIKVKTTSDGKKHKKPT